MQRPHAVDPQVAGGAVLEIDTGLLQQRRHRADQTGERLLVGGRQRIGELEQIDDRHGAGALMRRDVAFLADDGGVEGRIAGPRPQHAQVEIETVHLGGDELAIDLLADAPGPVVERRQPGLEVFQRCGFGRHRRRAVIGRTVLDHRRGELPPLRRQRHQVLSAATGRPARHCRQTEGERQQAEDNRDDAHEQAPANDGNGPAPRSCGVSPCQVKSKKRHRSRAISSYQVCI